MIIDSQFHLKFHGVDKLVKKMNFDDVLPYLSRGDFGKYQKKIYLLLCLPTILCAFHKFAGVFLHQVPDHRCMLENELHNASFELPEDVWRLSIPFDEFRNQSSSCEYFDDTGLVQRCSNFMYDNSQVQSSAVESFTLVCDRSSKRATADSMMMFGMLVGGYVFGSMSDKYGRRPTFMLSLVLQVAAGFAVAASPFYLAYLVARFIVGASSQGVFMVPYCLALELVGKESRLHAGVVIQFFYPAGYILLAGFAYVFQNNWRIFQFAYTLPGMLFLLYWFIIPESPRWLLGHGKKDKAVELIQKIAKKNNLKVPAEVLEKLEAEKVEKHVSKPSLFDLFKTPNLRNKSFLMFFNWFVISGTYYGLSWSTNDLGGDPIVNFILSALMDFPANYFVMLTLNRYGRKIILTGSMVASGIVLLLSVIVPSGQVWLVVTLAMCGKMTITVAYSVIYIFSAEQFPTVIRNVAIGACSMSARIGGISAPFLIFLSQYWKPLPFLIFGSTAFVGGFLSTFLPETHNRELPETLADSERLGKKEKKSASDDDGLEEVVLNGKSHR